jgi:hypothetical protein
MVVAVLLVVVVLVPVCGVGAGAGAPGVSICPASTETASVKQRIDAAQIRRKVFTL